MNILVWIIIFGITIKYRAVYFCNVTHQYGSSSCNLNSTRLLHSLLLNWDKNLSKCSCTVWQVIIYKTAVVSIKLALYNNESRFWKNKHFYIQCTKCTKGKDTYEPQALRHLQPQSQLSSSSLQHVWGKEMA